MQNRPFLNNLNGLRFLAASYTIFFHYFYFPSSEFLTTFFTHGHISVPFFFLLSGFVLSYSYHDFEFGAGGNTKKYILMRFIRLAPIYYISMALAIPLIIYNQLQAPLSVKDNLLYILSHLSMTQALFPFKELVNFWNVHSWSLSVEMFLYVCSPILIHLVRRITAQSAYFSLILLLLINTLFYYYYSFSNFPIKIPTYFAPLYLATFFNGVILAKIFILKRKLFEYFSSLIFIVSSSLLIFSFFADFESEFYTSFNPFYQICFSLLILGSCCENKFNRILGSKVFFFLGEASYAMYILQAPIKLITQQFLSKVIGYTTHNGPIFSISIYISILVAAIILTVYIDPYLRKTLREKLL